MDVIQSARELGKALQADQRYQRYTTAKEKNDSDVELQSAIAKFSEKRAALNAEIQKQDKDAALIKEMNAEVSEMYAAIFENENMQEFTNARNDMQELLGFINQIVNGSAGGQDPETIEYQADCGGDCGGCAGCS